MIPSGAARTRALLLALAFAAGTERLEAGETFDLERLADGVYAALVQPNPPANVLANVLIGPVERAIRLPEFQSSFTAGEPERIEAYRESVRAAIERACREEAGDISP